MKYKITLNGKTYEVVVEKGEAILAAEYEAATPAAPVAAAPVAAAPVVAAPVAAAPAAVAVTGEPVNAPLPGTVVAVKVAAGEAVKKGQILVIIEAMKMENEVVAPRDGTVAQVITSKGASVNSGDPLVSLA